MTPEMINWLGFSSAVAIVTLIYAICLGGWCKQQQREIDELKSLIKKKKND